MSHKRPYGFLGFIRQALSKIKTDREASVSDLPENLFYRQGVNIRYGMVYVQSLHMVGGKSPAGI